MDSSLMYMLARKVVAVEVEGEGRLGGDVFGAGVEAVDGVNVEVDVEVGVELDVGLEVELGVEVEVER